MIAYLDRSIGGQVRAKRDLATSVYNHYIARALREQDGEDLGRHHLLLLGPTGSGKSFLVRTLSRFLGVPVGFCSATSLVEVGYRGSTVESVVRTLLDRSRGDASLAERGIIFLDEIDKIRRGEQTGRDVSGEGVQNALLTLLDGRISTGEDNHEHAAVDTSKILFICAGAFVGLEEIVNQRLGRGIREVGFQAATAHAKTVGKVKSTSQAEQGRTLDEVQTEDLVVYGFIPEFIGRFPTLSVMHSLDYDDLRAIAGGATENSPFDRQQKLARAHGIELMLTEQALDAIAREAEKMGTGVRGLDRLIGKALDGVDFRLPDLAADGVTKIEIDDNAALGRGEPKLIKGKRKLPRLDGDLRKTSLSGVPMPSLPDFAPPSSSNQFTNTGGWSNERIWKRIEQLREQLDWENTTGSARKWWKSFEEENKAKPGLVLRLIEELLQREATISSFFLSYVYSNCDNIQANLHYFDYSRLKKAEDEKKQKDE